MLLISGIVILYTAFHSNLGARDATAFKTCHQSRRLSRSHIDKLQNNYCRLCWQTFKAVFNIFLICCFVTQYCEMVNLARQGIPWKDMILIYSACDRALTISCCKYEQRHLVENWVLTLCLDKTRICRLSVFN